MKQSFPWLALVLGLLLALLLGRFSPLNPETGPTLPLLTALLISEFGFIVTAIAAFLGAKDIARRQARARTILVAVGNALWAIGFLVMGLKLWPGGSFPGT